ncbi:MULTISPECIES: cbb3-type cytochrome c oxidase subunit 3 [unclassified Aureimonas]|uniref:cbb3-type cytochrome c oxidase subunit 3 n=1 Tax=unclassified Aureimonas TaxID=2615206 RepID=UPI0009E982C8|nr:MULTISPECIES: cbb3-type cytochrome c oxidase subunit 3 [unclassified Aureimonas]
MSFYDALRHFADSWALLALTFVFAAILVWAFRPGSKGGYGDQADIPFKYDLESMDRD